MSAQFLFIQYRINIQSLLTVSLVSILTRRCAGKQLTSYKQYISFHSTLSGYGYGYALRIFLCVESYPKACNYYGNCIVYPFQKHWKRRDQIDLTQYLCLGEKYLWN